MVCPATGEVVPVPFPFSDLSQSKLRPAVVLGFAGRGDWILCQITSKPYADLQAVEWSSTDFLSGSLPVISYARPGKLFTANEQLLVSSAGVLKLESRQKIVQKVVELLQPSASVIGGLGKPFSTGIMFLATDLVSALCAISPHGTGILLLC